MKSARSELTNGEQCVSFRVLAAPDRRNGRCTSEFVRYADLVEPNLSRFFSSTEGVNRMKES